MQWTGLRDIDTIDLALTTETGKVADSGEIDCPISDHSLIYVIRQAKTRRGKIKTIKCYNFKAYSTDKFVTDSHAASWDEVNTSLTADDASTSFKNTLISIADKHAPLQTKRVCRNTLPWVTDKIRSLMKQRNYHHKKAQKSGSSNEWHTYHTLKNLVIVRINEAKRRYYTNTIKENKADSAKLWKTLKTVISANVAASPIETITLEGSDITDPN